MGRHQTVDEYFAADSRWEAELSELRKLLNESGLEETLKWGAPCYTYRGKNVVGIGAFKAYFGLWFFQGALLEDEAGVLVNAQEGVTKALRQWRMQSAADIRPRLARRYLKEAMALVDAGRQIRPARNRPARNRPLILPDHLRQALEQNETAKARFDALTPGRQRAYAAYIEEAKREATRAKRIARILPMIEAGVGLNDRQRRQARK
jgi:uncharacterized protein YdeI (YjbR/CyaY-like superfamily)